MRCCVAPETGSKMDVLQYRSSLKLQGCRDISRERCTARVDAIETAGIDSHVETQEQK